MSEMRKHWMGWWLLVPASLTAIALLYHFLPQDLPLFKAGDQLTLSGGGGVNLLLARDRRCLDEIHALRNPEGSEARARARQVLSECTVSVGDGQRATMVRWADDYSEVKIDSGILEGRIFIARSEWVKTSPD
jgi:hypothetical protein